VQKHSANKESKDVTGAVVSPEKETISFIRYLLSKTDLCSIAKQIIRMCDV